MVRPAAGRTLDDIEGIDASGSATGLTPLVRRCLELRRIPIDSLTPEDLRVLLGQKIGVPALATLALALVEKDPFLEADLYPGDLTLALMEATGDGWFDAPKMRLALLAIAKDMSTADPGSGQHAVRAAARWAALRDERSNRRKRDDRQAFKKWWLASGGDPAFLEGED
jgi:hypothetical protein